MITKHYFYILESIWNHYTNGSIIQEDSIHGFKNDEIAEVKSIYLKYFNDSYHKIHKAIYLGSEDFENMEDLELRTDDVMSKFMENKRVINIIYNFEQYEESEIYSFPDENYNMTKYHLFTIPTWDETIIQYNEDDIIEHDEKNNTILIQESKSYGDVTKYKYVIYKEYLGSIKCGRMHSNDDQFKEEVLKLIKGEN